jgi:hypothetical protein
MNILLRFIIIAIAGYAIWQLSDSFSLAVSTLAKPAEARWFNVLSSLGEAVVEPALAVAAVTLAVVNKRLWLAAIFASTALIFYFIPFVAFLIGIIIYGF